MYAPKPSIASELDPTGNIYISGAKVFGVYSKDENFYWTYILDVEFEDDFSDLIRKGMKFVNTTQWDKKLSVTEVVELVENPNKYYKYAHAQLENEIATDPFANKCKIHQDLDTKLGINI